VLKLSHYYGLGITQFYELQQWYEYKIFKTIWEENRGMALSLLFQKHINL
jgi:hypothetical protein